MSLTPVRGSLASRWVPSCPGVLPEGVREVLGRPLCRWCPGSDCRLVLSSCLVVINLGLSPQRLRQELWSLTVKTFGLETELISVACFGLGFDLSRLKSTLMVERKLLALPDLWH